MLIHTKLIAVMRDISAISKDKRNANQGYNFRGIDDVYNELHDIMAKHGVFSMPEVITETYSERETAKGGALIYRVLKIKYTFYCEDESTLSCVVIGEGMDSGDKASNKALSVAHKYALLQIFCIPTQDAKDPENDSPAVKPLPQKAAPIPTISEAQALDIVEEVGKREAPDFLAKVHETYKVKELTDIPVSQLPKIMKSITSKPLKVSK